MRQWVVFSILLCCLETQSLAYSNQDLWEAARLRDWTTVRAIFKSGEGYDLDFAPVGQQSTRCYLGWFNWQLLDEEAALSKKNPEVARKRKIESGEMGALNGDELNTILGFLGPRDRARCCLVCKPLNREIAFFENPEREIVARLDNPRIEYVAAFDFAKGQRLRLIGPVNHEEKGQISLSVRVSENVPRDVLDAIYAQLRIEQPKDLYSGYTVTQELPSIMALRLLIGKLRHSGAKFVNIDEERLTQLQNLEMAQRYYDTQMISLSDIIELRNDKDKMDRLDDYWIDILKKRLKLPEFDDDLESEEEQRLMPDNYFALVTWLTFLDDNTHEMRTSIKFTSTTNPTGNPVVLTVHEAGGEQIELVLSAPDTKRILAVAQEAGISLNTKLSFPIEEGKRIARHIIYLFAKAGYFSPK